MSLQQLRDQALYVSGYLQGRQLSFTGHASKIYGILISKMSSFISLPLPFLSFLALPFFGSTSTSVNLVLFYLTWSSLIWTHDPLDVEAYGTLATKLLAFLIPSIGFLGFDLVLPSLSASTKAKGKKQLPARYDRQKLATVAGWSIFNIVLSVALQAGIELVLTKVLHMRSALRVSTLVPTPWGMAKELGQAFVLRGVLHYVIHRYVLHASPQHSILATWHKTWAHSLTHVFSVAAGYDHPVCYLLAHWIPVYLPAVLLRLHILTWLTFLALTSAEAAIIYSGYAVLPSSILLPGMARRLDKHYETGGTGNFGQWGVLDWVFGTSCPGEADLVDDLEDEADKRQVKRRMGNALDNADGLVGDAKKRFGGKKRSEKDDNAEDDSDDGEEQENDPDDKTEQTRSRHAPRGEDEQSSATARRSKRNTRKS